MRLVERTVVEAAPQDVWAILTDWERQASWMPDVAWIRPLGPGRQLGARFLVRTRVFGVAAVTDVMRVTGWDPPRRLTIRHEGVVRGRGEWRLDPAEDDTTRFTWVESIRMRPPGLGELLLIAYSPWQRWMLRRSVRNLRRLVERSAR